MFGIYFRLIITPVENRFVNWCQNESNLLVQVMFMLICESNCVNLDNTFSFSSSRHNVFISIIFTKQSFMNEFHNLEIVFHPYECMKVLRLNIVLKGTKYIHYTYFIQNVNNLTKLFQSMNCEASLATSLD